MRTILFTAAAVVAFSTSAQAQCPASVTLTAAYFASIGQDGSGAAVRGPGDTYDTLGSVLSRALIVGFDFSAISSLCRPTSARYAYSTRAKSGTVYTMRGMLGGAGRPTGNIVDDLTIARTNGLSGGLMTFSIDAAPARIQLYVLPSDLDKLDQRIIHGEYWYMVLQPPGGTNTGWREIHTPWATNAKRPKITLWLEDR
jgi:hypothetical protein